jgi:endonuclease/exonuclease/phosphatase family metal-dependent hydrolase
MLARHAVNDVARAAAPDSLTVGSVNIHGGHRITDPLVAWIESRSLDIVVLQEVGYASTDGATITTELAGRLGFHAAYVPAFRRDGGETQGLATLSRYPLEDVQTESLQYNQLRFHSRCRVVLAATMKTDVGEVRVVNVHLDTRINSESRVAQLEPILDKLRSDGTSQIVAGDFNTSGVGWWQSTVPLPFAQQQGAAVRAAMTAEGFATPFGDDTRPTFKLAGLPLRLDWIYLKRLMALDWSVDDMPFSDHRAIWTRMAAAK